MNRSTALLLALAALLAHVLTLHQDSAGRLGPPLDGVHVAFRLGRELVHGGAAPLAESYPSAAWIALAALAERLTWAPTVAAQLVAILCVLATVWVVSRFSPARLAGVIAPLLCVVSGSIASAAGGGSEFALFGLGLCTAFLGFEHGRGRVLALGLVLASLARPEGLLVGLGFLALTGLARARAPRQGGAADGGSRIRLSAFLVPLLLEVVFALVRWRAGGPALSPTLGALFDVSLERATHGAAEVWDFALHSGAPALVVVPILVALVGRLAGRPARALLVALGWVAYVALQGGPALPFWAELAPALPLVFLGVQETLTRLIDERREVFRRVGWALFGLGLASSALASKLPSDVGPLPLAALHRAWLGDERDASDDPLDLPRARVGVERAVRQTERLRALGVFLRDNLDPRASIASPWPGAVSYLSRRTAQDLFGRSTVLPGDAERRTWFGARRTDLLAAFDGDADYVVPFLLEARRAPRVVPLVQTWFRRYDRVGDEPERMAEFWRRFENYDLITVPVPTWRADASRGPYEPFFLLRHRRLGLAPQLVARVEERRLIVDVQHAGHLQLVDLAVSLQNAAGEVRSLRPTGHFEAGQGVHARNNLMLMPTGERQVRLLEVPLPPDFRPTHVLAVLRNPGSQGEAGFSHVSNEVVLDLR